MGFLAALIKMPNRDRGVRGIFERIVLKAKILSSLASFYHVGQQGAEPHAPVHMYDIGLTTANYISSGLFRQLHLGTFSRSPFHL